ncbi:HDOD domain-containing protein [Ideonella sp. YS5]|uniref:HDOD domain-containing protein n=1 Tax=Ideonella sp. YS5 TaxID=3453714 RepID=UPI003EEE440A
MLSALARQVRNLPALPQAVLEARQLLDSEDVAFEPLADAISHDSALAADLLRLANSSLYGLAGRVRTVRDAVSVLGLRNLDMLLTAAALRGALQPAGGCPFDALSHWRHGVATGLCAFHLAAERKQQRDAAFTAGLLHDLGRLAMACVAPGKMQELLSRQAAEDAPALGLEQHLWGTDHAGFGAIVAQHWHFGADIVEAIRHHHAPPERPVTPLVDIVHVADAMVHALDINALPAERVPAIHPLAWNRLALSDEACLRVFGQTEAGLEELCQALGL